MKLLTKFYSNAFCSIIKAEEIEIKSNKILVTNLTTYLTRE